MGEAIGRIEGIVLDVADLERAMAFWSALTGLAFGPSATPPCRAAALPSGLRLVLQRVPERKRGRKNRVHLDIEVPDLEAALGRVEAIGGRLVARVTNEAGPLAVCADPDGNEFCLVTP